MTRPLTWALAVSLAMAAPATARERTCPDEHDRTVMTRFVSRLASQDSTEDARDLALSKLRLGHVAIARASRVLPGEALGLAEAEARLTELEAAVRAGRSPAEVAAPFERLGSMEGRCAYTTVEVVVIVIGFVLGILPGIIFLFLFC